MLSSALVKQYLNLDLCLVHQLMGHGKGDGRENLANNGLRHVVCLDAKILLLLEDTCGY